MPAPIRKGKLGTPNQFGYVAQLAEVTANTGRGARGHLLPAATAPGNRARIACFPRPFTSPSTLVGDLEKRRSA
jgi:hypothetical protein